MRILIIGSGGREHALAWKLKQCPAVTELFVAPGNGGTAGIAVNVPIKDNDIPALVAFAREKAVDLVVPGPELPLTLGVVDAMKEAGIPCFGPVVPDWKAASPSPRKSCRRRAFPRRPQEYSPAVPMPMPSRPNTGHRS